MAHLTTIRANLGYEFRLVNVRFLAHDYGGGEGYAEILNIKDAEMNTNVDVDAFEQNRITDIAFSHFLNGDAVWVE